MKFSHLYDKLDFLIFPTVRSVKYMVKHGLFVNSTDLIIIGSNKFVGKLIGYEDRLIKEIPLIFLQYDASPYPIHTHEDFVELLNSFLPEGWGHNSVNTMKRILWWKKEGDD